MNPAEKERVLNLLRDSKTRLTARQYQRDISAALSVSRREAGKILKDLVEARDLSYLSVYGNTYVEECFDRPVQITDHFVLIPAGHSFFPENDTFYPIFIEPGISFGSGQHPTTRLCLEALDMTFFGSAPLLPDSAKGADIGTGSGVLALAMCIGGIEHCGAWEIDPVSVHEARKNVAHNNCIQKVEVVDGFFEGGHQDYSLICANLRTPTLFQLSQSLSQSIKDNGILILSGIRAWESQELSDCFHEKGFTVLWQKTLKDWFAVILQFQKPGAIIH